MNDCIEKLIKKKTKRLATLERQFAKWNEKKHMFISPKWYVKVPNEIATIKNQLVVLEQVKHEC